MSPRTLTPLLTVLALAATLPAGATAASQTTVPTDRATATLDACHSDPVQSARYATFAAQMTQIKAGKSMSVRFDLFQRNQGEGFRPVAVPAPGFGVWHPSAAGVGILRYSQEVANLPAPAGFRVQASFRWLNARRRVIRRAHRVTPVCLLPDERPNLVAGPITPRRGPDKDSMIYDVVVRNDGLGGAGPFAVGLSIAGHALPEMSIAGLAASGRQVVTFSGPSCAGAGSVTATVDFAGAVDQTTRADDTRSITC